MEIKGVSIDSRSIKEGELFIAIKGPNYDGHDFVRDAIKKGAWGALVERSTLESKLTSLEGIQNILPVGDTLDALQEMAYMHRNRFSIPIIGVTGSNGKTTTKEMLAGILKQQGPVLKNEGNLNNHLGVPLTLLKLDTMHKAAVVEMGTSAPGEIELLSRLTRPTVGVITNVGPAHLEFFGNLDGVAAAKGEMIKNVSAEGTVVLNADDAYCGFFKKEFNGRIMTFGIGHGADVRVSEIQTGRDSTDFTLDINGARVPVRLRTIGTHNVYNALAAAAAAAAVGLSADAVKYGLDGFIPVSMRSEIKQLQGRTIYADYYNANPASMRAALVTLVSLKADTKAVAVLGDMLELGGAAVKEHRDIGSAAATLDLDVLITMGTLAKEIAAGAIEAGMSRKRVFQTETHEEASALLKKSSKPGDVVLVKGSRGMKMEKILEGF